MPARLKPLLLSAATAFGLVAGIGVAIAASEREAVNRVLGDLALQATAHGVLLSWGRTETGGFLFGTDVSVHDIRIRTVSDAHSVAISELVLEDVELDSAGAVAGVATLELTGLAGHSDIDAEEIVAQPAWTIASLTVGSPDLIGIIRHLGGPDPLAGDRLLSLITLLATDHMALADLRLFAEAGDPIPIATVGSFAIKEFTQTSIDVVEVEDVAWTVSADGEVADGGFGRIRLDDIDFGDTVRSLEDRGDRAGVFSLLSGTRVGSVEIDDAVGRDGLWEQRIGRSFMTTRDGTGSGYAAVEFGTADWTIRPLPGNSFGDSLRTAFPPDGELSLVSGGRVAFDADAGFIGMDQQFGVEGVGAVAAAFAVSGIPDTPVGDLERFRKVASGPPRLETFRFSIVDDGGLEIAMTILGQRQEDGPRSASEMRKYYAEMFEALAAGFADTSHPRIREATVAVRRFILLGGTLTAGIENPVPLDLPDGTTPPGDALDTYGFYLRHRPPEPDRVVEPERHDPGR